MCALGLKGDNRKEIKKKRIGHNIADNIIYINVKIYYLKNRAGPGFYLFWSGRPQPLHILPSTYACNAAGRKTKLPGWSQYRPPAWATWSS